MASSMAESIEILVMGKTGNGRSATCNSILGREAFVTSADAAPTLWYTQNAHARYGDQTVRVVEAPGMCHTARGEHGSKKEISREFAQVFFLCRRGVDAMLLVIRFGQRFTQEELRVVKTVKRVFGEDFLRKRCVLVFTFGELFDMDVSRKKSFGEWIENQQGHLKDLIEECDYRCVLFRNCTEETMDEQREELFNLINEIKEKEGKRHNFMDVFGKKAAVSPPTNVTSDPSAVQESIGLLQDSLTKTQIYMQKESARGNYVPDKVVNRVSGDIRLVRQTAVDNECSRTLSRSGSLTSLNGNLERMENDISNESLRQENKKDFQRILAAHIQQCQKWMEGLYQMNKQVAEQMEFFSDLLLEHRVLEQ